MNALIPILKVIKSGKTSFQATSNIEKDLSDFQDTVCALREAWNNDFLLDFIPHKESQSGNDWTDCVSIGGLTPKGEELICKTRI